MDRPGKPKYSDLTCPIEFRATKRDTRFTNWNIPFSRIASVTSLSSTFIVNSWASYDMGHSIETIDSRDGRVQ